MYEKAEEKVLQGRKELAKINLYEMQHQLEESTET